MCERVCVCVFSLDLFLPPPPLQVLLKVNCVSELVQTWTCLLEGLPQQLFNGRAFH